jgi:hypothetical protein
MPLITKSIFRKQRNISRAEQNSADNKSSLEWIWFSNRQASSLHHSETMQNFKSSN